MQYILDNKKCFLSLFLVITTQVAFNFIECDINTHAINYGAMCSEVVQPFTFQYPLLQHHW